MNESIAVFLLARLYNRLIITPGNVEELKDAILTLLENKYLSEAITEKAYNTIIKS